MRFLPKKHCFCPSCLCTTSATLLTWQGRAFSGNHYASKQSYNNTRIQQYVPWILILAKRELRSQKARVRKRNKRIHCSLCRHFSVKISPEKRNPLLWKNVSIVKKIEWVIMVSFQGMKKEILVFGSLCLGCGGLWLSRWKVITDNGAISLQANLTPPNQCQPKARP